MMKFLFLFACTLILLALIASRFRRQIANLAHLWRALKKMNSDRGEIRDAGASDDLRLIKCTVCGTWTPHDDSREMRNGVYYCSADCIAKSATKA